VPVLLQPQADTELIYDASTAKHPFRAVVLNHGDESFIKVLLDEVSLGFFS
jgi:hypothetical protein